ncbi:---NA---, partial [Paramuricea clavata]
RDMHILILDEVDGRIVVRHSGGADSGNSIVKTGDLLLCVGNVSLVGLSLGQAQSVIDDMLKRDEEKILLVIGVTPDRASADSAPVSSNWSFAQKDLSNIDERDLVFDTKF